MTKEIKRGIERRRSAKVLRRTKRRAKQLRKISPKDLLDLIPIELMEKVADQTGVDKHVKHLFGPILIQLFLLAILDGKDTSQQSLADLYNSTRFSAFSGKGKHETAKSSLSSRLNSIKCTYLEELFSAYMAALKQKYGKQLNKEYGWLARFDSTMLALCASITQIGMRVGAKPKKGQGKVQIKISLGLEGLLPNTLKVYHEQSMLSEERALKQAIESNPDKRDKVVVFDMGIKSRKTFKGFDLDKRLFVTRVDRPRHEVLRTHKSIKGRMHGDLKFESDQIVYLYQSGNKEDSLMRHEFRLICAKCIKGDNVGKSFYFLTNILDLSAFEIADIYLMRWDIEVFFRFLKQEIGLRNLLSTKENGIQAVIYLRMLVGTMIWVYAHLNKRKDFKRVKTEFRDDIDWAITVAIAQLIAATGITDRDKLYPDFQGIISKQSP